MNDRQVECFLKLVETESFSRAAEELYITQPNITHHIKMIEKELNVKLIERTTTSFELTTAGKAFHKHCLKIMEALEDTRIDMLKYQNKNEIKIGFPSLLLTYNIERYNRIMEMIHTKYPELTIIPKIIEGVDKTSALESNEVDLVISKLNIKLKKKYHYDFLFKQGSYLMVSDNHPLNDIEDLSYQHLTSYPLYLISSETSFNEDLKNVVGKEQKIVVFPTYESIYNLVKDGTGIAISSYKQNIEGIRFLPINIFDNYDIGCVYYADADEIIKDIAKIIQTAHMQYR